ncbi:unknown protein [Desulfotalea psychrophila LSv54]|uniref:Transporter suffix domain-containing protein n=2 Tax=Desulfotalea psychrophila TaxID=84980 RepID=Q6AKY2_DESPS|nr:unknown protein [Desulfotalea psychrophila LSv54]
MLSFLLWAVILLLPFLEISTVHMAESTTVLIISAEVAFFSGIALLGKEAWQHIKARFKGKG